MIHHLTTDAPPVLFEVPPLSYEFGEDGLRESVAGLLLLPMRNHGEVR